MKFPDNFYFGAATAAHQVEGGNSNDWTEFERKNAGRLAKKARKKDWPEHLLQNYPNPLQEENYISGKACDHYRLYKEDFEIASYLGQNAHRFSIEWSRVEPEEGKFDEKEIEHYRDVIRELRQRNLEPFVTLWHWTIPLWLKNKGGVASGDFIGHFIRFSERMTKRLDGVRFWLTVNEPLIYAPNSYLDGDWPPQKKNLFLHLKVINNLTKAHKEAYKILKRKNLAFQIGTTQNIPYFEKPLSAFPRWWYTTFLNRIKDCQDFIGLNYYFYYRTPSLWGLNPRHKKDNKDDEKISDMNWKIYPEGIYHILKDLEKYQKPIYVTENGVADTRDIYRKFFIREHLRWIHKAIQEGIDVRGYFYWSLLDNFEWDKGFWPRFGLLEVDYRTLERKIRPSALVYKEIIENGL